MQRAFESLFPEFDQEERCEFFVEGNSSLDHPLEGWYEIKDFYCLEGDCDCRKVSIAIVDRQGKRRALISYGWESSTFYQQWGLDQKIAQMLTQGYLEPGQQQSEHADFFLNHFLFLKKEPEVVDWFKKRYHLFKKAIASKTTKKTAEIIPFTRKR